MQYSQRDPNRDHVHGRVYRLVYRDKPLLQLATQFGKCIQELLAQLNEYEWRTRCRARRELQSRDSAEVLAAAKAWLAGLDSKTKDFDRLRCEVLWLQQHFHTVDAALLRQALTAESFNARAAATRTLADERERIEGAFELLTAQAIDSHPRVRTEAVRGLSFYATPEAAAAELAALAKDPADYFVKYTTEAALGANQASWQTKHITGELAGDNAELKQLLDSLIATDKKGAAAVPYLQILLGKGEHAAEEKNKAMQALADLKVGSADNGKAVFRRNCIACHRVYNEGAAFGPDMLKVGTRLTLFKLVESIINPNAEIDEKYLSTSILTSDGRVTTGLLVSQSAESIVIFDGKQQKTIPVDDVESQQKLKQSSMPEGLAGTIAPAEFLDLIAFLASLK